MNFFAKAFDIFELCRLSNQRLDKLLREHGSKIAKEQQDMAKLQNILQNIKNISSKTPTEQPLKVDTAGGSHVKTLPNKQKEPVPKGVGNLSKLSHNEHTNRDAEANEHSEVEIDSELGNNHSEVEGNNSEFEDSEELEIRIVEEDVESQGKIIC